MMRYVFLPTIRLREPKLTKNVWYTEWLGGVGAREGLRERTFVQWCKRKGHLCIRTVDLFWYLDYYSHGFPRFSKKALRESWQCEVESFWSYLRTGD